MTAQALRFRHFLIERNVPGDHVCISYHESYVNEWASDGQDPGMKYMVTVESRADGNHEQVVFPVPEHSDVSVEESSSGSESSTGDQTQLRSHMYLNAMVKSVRAWNPGAGDLLFIYVRSHGYSRVTGSHLATGFVAPDGSEVNFVDLFDFFVYNLTAETIVFFVDGCYSSYMTRVAQDRNTNRTIFVVSSSYGGTKWVSGDEAYFSEDLGVKSVSYFFDVLLAELGQLLDNGGQLSQLVRSIGEKISERIPLRYTWRQPVQTSSVVTSVQPELREEEDPTESLKTSGGNLCPKVRNKSRAHHQ